jgi:hypothetical protein
LFRLSFVKHENKTLLATTTPVMQRNAAKRQTPSQGWRNIVKNCLENFRVGYNESLQMVLCGKPGGKTKQWTVKTTNL